MAQRDTSTVTRLQPRTSQGDGESLAHIVMKRDQMRGYVAGEPIEALCGKKWVPSRDFSGLPVCKACAAERDRIVAGMKGLN